MDAILVVIRNVFTEQAPQMALVKYNDVIEQLASDSAYPSFGNPILPGAAQ